jgi:DNA-binding transcriptional regulator GbsR (MarR family)
MALNAAQRAFVERFGVFFEQLGHQPAGSRIMGLLLLADPPQMTFDEIKLELGLSKSAVSTSLNMLIALDLLEYVTNSGERKRYFRIRTDAWTRTMIGHLKTIETVQTLLREARELRPESAPELNEQIDEVIDFHAFFHEELVKMWAKWKNHKNVNI